MQNIRTVQIGNFKLLKLKKMIAIFDYTPMLFRVGIDYETISIHPEDLHEDYFEIHVIAKDFASAERHVEELYDKNDHFIRSIISIELMDSQIAGIQYKKSQ